MKVKTHTTEQIIQKLREVERLHSEGKSISEACKQITVSEHTFYEWPKRFGTMQPDEAKRLKELESENARLKRLVAKQALGNLMLKELARGNALAPREATTCGANPTREVRGLATSCMWHRGKAGQASGVVRRSAASAIR